MRSIQVKDSAQILVLGYEGENEAARVAFDVSGWTAAYGEGVFQLIVMPPGGTTPYPAAVEVDGETVLWTVSDTDTAAPGYGRAQLSYYVGDVLAKSTVWRTVVLDSLGAPGEAPDAYETWLSTLQALAAETQQNADTAEAAAEAVSAVNIATVEETLSFLGVD